MIGSLIGSCAMRSLMAMAVMAALCGSAVAFDAESIDLGEAEAFGTLTVPVNGQPDLFQVAFEKRAGIARIRGKDLSGRFILGIADGSGFQGEIVGADGQAYVTTDASGRIVATPSALNAPPSFAGDTVKAEAPFEVAAAKVAKVGGENRLDILVLYTQRALDEAGADYIQDISAAGVNRMTAIFANSAVPYTANLVGVEKSDLSDPPNESVGDFGGRACGSNAESNNRQALIERFHPDVTVFFTGVKDRAPIGLAILYDGYSGAQGLAVSCAQITLRPGDQVQNFAQTFTHEVGHVLGGGHDHSDPNASGWKPVLACDALRKGHSSDAARDGDGIQRHSATLLLVAGQGRCKWRSLRLPRG